MLEHSLTDAQIQIYDAYAGAFGIIHNNLDAALQAAGVTGATGTLNGAAKSAARSAFESAKQRFFSHLISAMKTLSLITAIEADLAAGHAAVIQLVSTGEALTERRLAEIPTEEWNDVRVDITPREACLDYLAHSFPTQLYEPYTNAEGKLSSRPVMRDGQPVPCREAVERRDRLIETLASLPAVPGALDQIVQHFGADRVAEVTGRSRRIVRRIGADGIDRLVVENRPGSASLGEARAFMDDDKRILVFSDAGGTGRSYHAELSAKNRRLRVHYLLEAGWKADAAIQGLGRTNRTNQAQPPLFRPIATDVKAEKRFLSTIARRLDTLGAITKGQRQTGGQGLFRPEDNLESHYARDALRQLYVMLVGGRVAGCTLTEFEDATGLKLTDSTGIKDDLPPITTFLNRLLALTIGHQNILFTVFEQLMAARVEGAIASGVYDLGLETLTAESFVVSDRRVIYRHPATAAETRLLTIARKQRNRPLGLGDALALLDDRGAMLLVNGQSGRAAVQLRRRRACCWTTAPWSAASASSGRWSGAPWLSTCSPRRSGRRPTGRASPGSGRPRSRRCRSSSPTRSTSSPACCCRSGGACPMESRPASTGFRPTPASASSGARRPPPGSTGRSARRRRASARTPPSPAWLTAASISIWPTVCTCAASASWAPTASSSPASARRCAIASRPMASSTRSSPGSSACSCPPTATARPCWRRCCGATR